MRYQGSNERVQSTIAQQRRIASEQLAQMRLRRDQLNRAIAALEDSLRSNEPKLALMPRQAADSPHAAFAAAA